MNKMHDVPADGPLAAEAAGEARDIQAQAASGLPQQAAEPAEGAADEPGIPAQGAAAAPRRRARKRQPAEPIEAVDVLLDVEPAPSQAPATGMSVLADADSAFNSQTDATQGHNEPSGESASVPSTERAERPRGDRNRRRGRRGRGDRENGPAGMDGAAAADAEAGARPGPGDAAPRAPRPAPDAGALFAEVVSGAYDEGAPAEPAPDAAAGTEPLALGKRVLRPEPEAPKLHKVLAQSGIGSRRDMEQLIMDGRVTVNGEPAHIGMRVAQGDRVAVSGKPVKVRIAPPPARMIAYHKPVGEVVTFNDPEGRPTVFRNLPRLPHGKWQSVGRLDINTEGLLLFTTSGDLANQLMHPRFGVEREYAVRVLGDIDPDARAELLEGVEIEGHRCAFRSIDEGGGDGANRWYRVIITEGRHREVRRMFEEVGLVVSRLIRIRYGAIVLPKGLHRGEWVELDEDDVREIRRLAQTAVAGARPDGQQRTGLHGRGGRDRNNRGKPRPDRGFGPAPQGAMEGEVAPPPLAPAGAEDSGPDDPLHIPNPLEQTFDRRFATGSKRITSGFGRPSDDSYRGGTARAANNKGAKAGPKQPDPMQTSVGYIGADAYFNKPGGNRRRGGRGR